jgi:tetratricopeptide (TPR) repeat protein
LDFDVFLSYTNADKRAVASLRNALVAHNLRVWLDEDRIEPFTSISHSVEQGLAKSAALVAYYSRNYPKSRACQWELTAAFLAAQRIDGNPRVRVLVVNPEPGVDHLQPLELRDALFIRAPGDEAELQVLAKAIKAHIRDLSGALGDDRIAAAPPWHGRQPVGAARFVGRINDMWALHSALSAVDAAMLTGARGKSVVKLAGLGGIGKSLLAQEYAMRFAAAYPGGVFWLRAHGHDDIGERMTSVELDARLRTQLRTFGEELGIDVTGLTPESIRAELVRALDGQGDLFLWIVDDLPGGLDLDTLEAWLAPGRNGRTLITTRSRDYASLGEQLDLGMIAPEAGLELLRLHQDPIGSGERTAAQELAEDLGCHALAVDVAGAAVRAQEIPSYARYREAIADPTEDELELAAGLAGLLPTGHEASIASTFLRSIHQLGEVGVDVLRFASRLATDPIVEDFVAAVFLVADQLDEAEARRRAFVGLQEAEVHSLSERVGDSEFQVHPIVSRTVRFLEASSSRSGALADSAISLLAKALATTNVSKEVMDAPTLSHARHLAAPLVDQVQQRLFNEISLQQILHGDFEDGLRLARDTYEATAGTVGPAHPNALASAQNIGHALIAAGHADEAAEQLADTVKAARRELGPDHPLTLMGMSNLGIAYRLQGNLAGAVDLHEAVLEARRRLLGEDHAATLETMNNLAMALLAQGNLSAAYELQESILEGTKARLGFMHREALRAAANLAEIKRLSGRLESAQVFNETTLLMQFEILGAEHPDTLITMNNLANTVADRGDLASAIELHRGALEIRIRKLGTLHPHTLNSMNNLALTLERHGERPEAIELMEQALEGRTTVFGPEHPDTLRSRTDLTDMLKEH